jgi:uncharacterized protein YeaO (DUF488 family)
LSDIQLKRAYEPSAPEDGKRILVDRIWPRGIRKVDLRLDDWNREVAPSTELRRWFGHKVERWDEFRRRYRAELAAHPEALAPLIAAVRQGRVTLVFGARDTAHNQAVVLREFLDESAGAGS